MEGGHALVTSEPAAVGPVVDRQVIDLPGAASGNRTPDLRITSALSSDYFAIYLRRCHYDGPP
jgi:hypothetical protein